MILESSRTISNHYFNDTKDFLTRFDVCYKIAMTKSSRGKCYTDLRMALECILKAVICYHRYQGQSPEKIIQKIRKKNHSIVKLLDSAREYIDESENTFLSECALFMDKNFNVAMRYRIDAWERYEAANYTDYDKIANDVWLLNLRQTIDSISKKLDKKLKSHSKIVRASEILPEILLEIFPESEKRTNE